MHRLLRALVLALVVLLLLAPAATLLAWRLLPPPVTPLMLIRLAEGEGLAKDWQPLSRISPHLARAVIASEDGLFCRHWGFDWGAIENAADRYMSGRGRLLGASTISMQTAKNLYLWPGRDFLRKGLEAWLTVWVEALLPKQRIMALYLNIIEWGPGIYGAEAAARHHFNKSAAALTRDEAARLAAILPNPRLYQPRSAYAARRAGTILARMAAADTRCL